MGEKKTILCVDDDEQLRGFYSCVLGNNYNVMTADGGLAALALLDTAKPDLLISDCQMPGMNGFELVGKARLQYPDLDCIMASGTWESENQSPDLAHALGVKECLTKPFSPSALRTTVQKYLAPVFPATLL